MVTIRLISEIEVRCNMCDALIGTIHNGEFFPSMEKGTWQRMRIYDIKGDGEPMYDHEFEADFCNDCTEKWTKVVKRFKLTKAKVQRGR